LHRPNDDGKTEGDLAELSCTGARFAVVDRVWEDHWRSDSPCGRRLKWQERSSARTRSVRLRRGSSSTSWTWQDLVFAVCRWPSR